MNIRPEFIVEAFSRLDRAKVAEADLGFAAAMTGLTPQEVAERAWGEA